MAQLIIEELDGVLTAKDIDGNEVELKEGETFTLPNGEEVSVQNVNGKIELVNAQGENANLSIVNSITPLNQAPLDNQENTIANETVNSLESENIDETSLGDETNLVANADNPNAQEDEQNQEEEVQSDSLSVRELDRNAEVGNVVADLREPEGDVAEVEEETVISSREVDQVAQDIEPEPTPTPRAVLPIAYASISVDKDSVEERDGGDLTYTVSLVDRNGDPIVIPEGNEVRVAIDWSGVASGGADTSELPSSVSISGGSSTSFRVTPVNDVYEEVSEPLVGTISSVSGGEGVIRSAEPLASSSSAESEITDGTPDVTTVSLSGDENIQEGNSATYTVNISNVPLEDVVVDVSYQHVDTDSGDIVTTTTQVTIPAGSSSVTFAVDSVDDNINEGDEVFNVSISNPRGGGFESLDLGNDTVNTTIIDNDSKPTITVEDARANEGNDLVHDVSLSHPSSSDEIYTFNLSDGTAEDGKDYDANPTFSNGVTLNSDGTITVPAGVTSFTVTYPSINDTKIEGDEIVNLNIGGETATSTIIDNDYYRLIDEDTSISEKAPMGDASSVTSFEVNGMSYSAGEEADVSGIGKFKMDSNGDYEFTPNKDWSGDVPIVTYTLNDGNEPSLNIDVSPIAEKFGIDVDSVTLKDNEGNNKIEAPESTGLKQSAYQLVTEKDSDHYSDDTASHNPVNGSDLANLIDNTNLAPLEEKNVDGLAHEEYNKNSDPDDDNLGIRDGQAQVTKGYIYLEAGQEVVFKGQVDNGVKIELGGRDMVWSNSMNAYTLENSPHDADREINSSKDSDYVNTYKWEDGDYKYNEPKLDEGVFGSDGTFTVGESGYYTLNIYNYNIFTGYRLNKKGKGKGDIRQGEGEIDLELSVDGGDTFKPITTDNFKLYENISDIRTNGQVNETLKEDLRTPDGETLDKDDGEGYYTSNLNKGYEKSDIALNNIEITGIEDSSTSTTDGGTEEMSIKLTGELKEDFVISDGTYSVTVDANGEADITDFNLTKLVLSGATKGEYDVQVVVSTTDVSQLSTGEVTNTATDVVKEFTINVYEDKNTEPLSLVVDSSEYIIKTGDIVDTGTVIAKAEASHSDDNATYKYSLSDNPNGYFSIDETSGDITLTAEGVQRLHDMPKGENLPTFEVHAEATLSDGSTLIKDGEVDTLSIAAFDPKLKDGAYQGTGESDHITIDAPDDSVDAKDGYDTVIFTMSDTAELDVDNLDLKNIEEIDLSQGGFTLDTLEVLDVKGMTDDGNTLKISGETDDTVKLKLNENEWTKNESASDSEYSVYEGEAGSETITLKIDNDIDVNTIP